MCLQALITDLCWCWLYCRYLLVRQNRKDHENVNFMQLVLGRIKTKSNGTTLTFQELSSFTQIYVIEYLKKIAEFCNSPHFCTLNLLEILSKKFKISLLESCNRAFRTRNS